MENSLAYGLFDRLSVGFIIWEDSEEQKIIHANATFQTLCGYKLQELIGISARALLLIDPVLPADEIFAEGEKGQTEFEIDAQLIRKDGRRLWVKERGKRVTEADGSSQVYIIVTDISAQKEENQRLWMRSRIDPLTGIFNKITTEEMVGRWICQHPSANFCALFVVDVDDFKRINDNFGHQFGDMVLTDISTRMKAMFRESDIVGRIGGDEYAAFLLDIPSEQVLHKKAKQLAEALCWKCSANETSFFISCSIGVSLFPQHGSSFDKLYRFADFALYEAKRLGKGQYKLFDSEAPGGRNAQTQHQ